MPNWIFINYRRDDSGPEARLIRDAALEKFGTESVFFDTDTPLGEVWPSFIRNALERSTAVLAIIGTRWFASSDEWGRRRIDDASDWVRQELLTALSLEKQIVPVYVGGIQQPPQEAFPEELRTLSTRQSITIRRDFWDNDVNLLIARLHKSGPSAEAHDEDIEEIGPYPVMRTFPPSPIDQVTLDKILKIQLGSWQKISIDPAKNQFEIFKEFKFSEFLEAVRFINEVAAGCKILDHHPRWENIYRTLRVYLTTWGINHQVSDRDVQLARYFDEAYSRFSGRVIPVKNP